ncbi:MAG: adenylate/guanylate cyclase domain-containing protein [Elusimicrobiota bacterium]
MLSAEDENYLNHSRMDFLIEVVSSDDSTGMIEFRLIPDPKRYEHRNINGKACWYDKLDKTIIPQGVLLQMASQMKGMPMHFKQQLVGKAEEYVQRRIPEIEKNISNGIPEVTFEDKSEEFLRTLEKDKLGFAILSLDVVGSTKLITQLEPAKYNKLVSAMFYEIGSIVPLFHGHVLKYTGDGVIAYFPEPSFVIQNDNALDCALTLRRLINDGLNSCLIKLGFPVIQIRIGLDSGEAYVQTVGSPATKQHKDIIGAVVSLAAKIQATAQPNGIHLGQIMLQNLHTNWRLKCVPVPLPEGWGYKLAIDKIYPIYQYQG